jgi:hypothetical protein
MSTPPVISEKQALYQDDPLLPTYDQQSAVQPRPRTPAQKRKKALLNLLGLCVANYLTLSFTNSTSGLSSALVNTGSAPHTQSTCQQSPILTPRGNLTDLYAGDSKERIIQWLSGAVQIPTEAYDDMADVEGDERFKVFGDFHNCRSSFRYLLQDISESLILLFPSCRPRRKVPCLVCFHFLPDHRCTMANEQS